MQFFWKSSSICFYTQKSNRLSFMPAEYLTTNTLLGQFVVVRKVSLMLNSIYAPQQAPEFLPQHVNPPYTHPSNSLISIQLELNNFDPTLIFQSPAIQDSGHVFQIEAEVELLDSFRSKYLKVEVCMMSKQVRFTYPYWKLPNNRECSLIQYRTDCIL